MGSKHLTVYIDVLLSMQSITPQVPNSDPRQGLYFLFYLSASSDTSIAASSPFHAFHLTRRSLQHIRPIARSVYSEDEVVSQDKKQEKIESSNNNFKANRLSISMGGHQSIN
jgi:hypothetical protein